MKKKFDVVTIGGATLDIMFSTDKARILKNRHQWGSKQLMAFELGSKIVSKDVVYSNGGGAANSAVSFVKLGFRTAIITAIGSGATASLVIGHLKKELVDISLIQRTAGHTGLSFIVTGGGKADHVIFAHRSANDLLRIKSTTLNNLNTKWFYVSSISGKSWQENLKLIFNSAKKKGVKVAWNPGGVQLEKGYPLLKKYLRSTEVLLLNKAEATQLVKSAGLGTTRIANLFKTLHRWGPKIIAITEGDKGATVCSVQKIYFEKALPVSGINTTGAGDAFGSSLVAGLMLYKGDLKRALKLAIIRSNYVVRKIGAQEGLLTLTEVKKLKYKI